MKWMFKFVFISAALWSGYWYFGARAQEKMYVDLLNESRDQGWTAESRNLGVSGFPNRFDTTLTDVNFRDPSGSWGWRGEEFQIKALSYQLNHIIMAWPGKQVLDTPEGEVSIIADLLRASLVVSPSVNLPLSRFQIEGEGVDLESEILGPSEIGQLNAAVFQDEDVNSKYRLGVELADITPPESLTRRLGGGRIFSGPIESFKLSAQLDFDREIDRLVLENETPPRLVSTEIEQSILVWGRSELTISGTLNDGHNGYVQGSLRFDVKNWEPLFDVFKQTSNLTTTEFLTLKRALDGAAGDENLVFTVNFQNGESSIGPFTIGPAPVYPF